jgi:agmatine deiminase
MTRRNFIYASAIFSSNIFLNANSHFTVQDKFVIKQSFMKEESEEHKRTWMSFVANDYIWSKDQIEHVKQDLAKLAKTIAKYEPVSILVNEEDILLANELLGDLDSHNYPIELISFKIDDLWLRDTGPTFVTNNNGIKGGINFNFNGWGNKQEYHLDSKVADFISKYSKAKVINSNLILEGGSFEIDGAGTAILTESSVLNDNRNPNISKKEFEKELKKLLGLKKIIWLKGIKDKDITDAHVDFYARFTKVGTVLVSRENYKETYDYDITRENIKILQNSTDSQGNKLNVIILDNPDTFTEKYGIDYFAAGYIGYYVCNKAVILQKFGDAWADKNAYNIIQKQFPNRIIEQISVDGIASGGGSIHCATQQEPLI